MPPLLSLPRPMAQRPGLARALAGSIGLTGLLAAACALAGLPRDGAAQPALAGRSALTAMPPQLQLGLGESTQLVYTPRRVLPPGLELGEPRPSKLGLEFRSPDTRQQLRSLMRVQITTDSALQFRPRSRGLELSYQALF